MANFLGASDILLPVGPFYQMKAANLPFTITSVMYSKIHVNRRQYPFKISITYISSVPTSADLELVFENNLLGFSDILLLGLSLNGKGINIFMLNTITIQ